MKTKTNTTYQKISITFLVIALALTQISYVFATSINPEKLVELTNQSRVQIGEKPLKIDNKLELAALNKANNMLEYDYFEHYSPYGLSPWDFIKESGYSYIAAGENLAMDFKTSEGIHNAWMDSPLHKKNILKPEFEDIGIATVKGEFYGYQTTMVVQMFGKATTKTSVFDSLIYKISSWLLGF